MTGPKDTERGYVERRVYLAGRCSVCGHKYQSYRKKYIHMGKCRKHRHSGVSEGQLSVFPETAKSEPVAISA